MVEEVKPPHQPHLVQLDTSRRKNAGREKKGIPINPAAPLQAARQFRWALYADGGLFTLWHWYGEFRAWRDSSYESRPPEVIRSEVYKWLESGRDGNGEAIIPKRRMVDDILDALKAVSLLDEPRAPCWLCQEKPAPASEFIACRNGLLHVPTLKLHPPTPNFFTVNALRIDYDEKAAEPAGWFQFLRSTLDDESIDALQELFGLLLTVETRYQKIFLIVGPKRSGKGTIGRILRALVGSENVCSPTLASLGTAFGLACLIGRTVGLLSDVRLGGKSDMALIAENLLRVSGEDSISVQRKFLTDWTGELPTRFVLFSNELPTLLDASGALASRIVLIETRQSFYGKEDLRLTDKLLDELPGILIWAIAGLHRLRIRGQFVQPASSLEALDQLELLGSPIKAFIADRCRVEPGAMIQCAELFAVWQEWCEAQGRQHSGTSQRLGRDLSSAFSGIRVRQRKDNAGNRHRYYDGIRTRRPDDGD